VKSHAFSLFCGESVTGFQGLLVKAKALRTQYDGISNTFRG